MGIGQGQLAVLVGQLSHGVRSDVLVDDLGQRTIAVVVEIGRSIGFVDRCGDGESHHQSDRILGNYQDAFLFVIGFVAVFLGPFARHEQTVHGDHTDRRDPFVVPRHAARIALDLVDHDALGLDLLRFEESDRVELLLIALGVPGEGDDPDGLVRLDLLDVERLVLAARGESEQHSHQCHRHVGRSTGVANAANDGGDPDEHEAQSEDPLEEVEHAIQRGEGLLVGVFLRPTVQGLCRHLPRERGLVEAEDPLNDDGQQQERAEKQRSLDRELGGGGGGLGSFGGHEILQ